MLFLVGPDKRRQILASVGGEEAVGPILMGMARPVHLLSFGAEVEEVVDMATIAVVEAQDIAGSTAEQLLATAAT